MKKYLQAGYTLVEMCIVLMVIGLLLVGILKGQELIENARMKALIVQVRSYEVAAASFRSTYDYWPGDMDDAPQRLKNCQGDCQTFRGDADDTIGPTWGYYGGPTPIDRPQDENRLFWLHLVSAGLISGVDARGVYQGYWGGSFPASKTGRGGFQVVYASITSRQADSRNSHYLLFRNLMGRTTPFDGDDSAALSGKEAYNIDVKMDDGIPGNGDVIAISDLWNCYFVHNNPDPNDPDHALHGQAENRYFLEREDLQACVMGFRIHGAD